MKKLLMVFAWLVNIFSSKAQKSIYDAILYIKELTWD
jgi:hypothetical protein